jgi:hypothetical protein
MPTSIQALPRTPSSKLTPAMRLVSLHGLRARCIHRPSHVANAYRLRSTSLPIGCSCDRCPRFVAQAADHDSSADSMMYSGAACSFHCFTVGRSIAHSWYAEHVPTTWRTFGSRTCVRRSHRQCVDSLLKRCTPSPPRGVDKSICTYAYVSTNYLRAPGNRASKRDTHMVDGMSPWCLVRSRNGRWTVLLRSVGHVVLRS